jgi:hypothetical protein
MPASYCRPALALGSAFAAATLRSAPGRALTLFVGELSNQSQPASNASPETPTSPNFSSRLLPIFCLSVSVFIAPPLSSPPCSRGRRRAV